MQLVSVPLNRGFKSLILYIYDAILPLGNRRVLLLASLYKKYFSHRTTIFSFCTWKLFRMKYLYDRRNNGQKFYLLKVVTNYLLFWSLKIVSRFRRNMALVFSIYFSKKKLLKQHLQRKRIFLHSKTGFIYISLHSLLRLLSSK